jgi:hypothetical protein
VVSIHLIEEVFDHYHGPVRHKLWLLAFAGYANDETRTGWPSRRLLAERIGVSVTRASNIATELVAEGVIKRDDAGRRGRGASRYVLMPLTPNEVRPERTLSAGNGVRPMRTPLGGDDAYPW